MKTIAFDKLSLRRELTLPIAVLATIAIIFVGLATYAGFSAARLAETRSQIAEFEAYQAYEAERHAEIASKQAALAAMASIVIDERIETRLTELEEMGVDVAGLVPSDEDAVGGPFDAADGGDETFAELFSSWRKLEAVESGTIAVPSDKPVKMGGLTSGYGMRSDPFKGKRSKHNGIDISGPVGTPIYATADGIVKRSGWNSGGYGNFIEIDHGRGIITRYAHMSKLLVKKGERVARGAKIGQMGSTGRSTGSHLHYEVRIDNRAVNPIPFMKSTDYLVAARESATAMESIGLGGGQ